MRPLFFAGVILVLAPSCGGRIAALDDGGSAFGDSMVDEDSRITPTIDGGESDATVTDASAFDASVVDSSAFDAGAARDSSVLDSSVVPDSSVLDASAVDSGGPQPDGGTGGDCPGTLSMELGFSYDQACDNFFMNVGQSNACTAGGVECINLLEAGTLSPQYSYCCFQPAPGSNCDRDYHVPQCIPR